MNRRGFIGSLIALVCGWFLHKAPAKRSLAPHTDQEVSDYDYFWCFISGGFYAIHRESVEVGDIVLFNHLGSSAKALRYRPELTLFHVTETLRRTDGSKELRGVPVLCLTPVNPDVEPNAVARACFLEARS